MIARIQGLLNELWKVPGQVKSDSREFHRGLATAIILLAPIAPHFSAELWEGMKLIPKIHCPEEDGLKWSESVFQQEWPKLDINYNMKLILRTVSSTNKPKELATLPIALWKYENFKIFLLN